MLDSREKERERKREKSVKLSDIRLFGVQINENRELSVEEKETDDIRDVNYDVTFKTIFIRGRRSVAITWK